MPTFYLRYFDYCSQAESFDSFVRELGGVCGAFNLIAPICIYHLTDVGWSEDALKATQTLAGKSIHLPAVKAVVFPDSSPADLLDFKAARTLSTADAALDAVFPQIQDLYNALFSQVVEPNLPIGHSFVIDTYGAYGYCVGNEGFYGDQIRLFPYYADAKCLIKRCQDFQSEVCHG